MAANRDDARTIDELARERASAGRFRRSPRARLAVACTLRRAHGSPVAGETRDVGPGGMCAATSRPLTIDERLSFELTLDDEIHVDGQARVLREQEVGVYALRFESLSEQARARLLEITR